VESNGTVTSRVRFLLFSEFDTSATVGTEGTLAPGFNRITRNSTDLSSRVLAVLACPRASLAIATPLRLTIVLLIDNDTLAVVGANMIGIRI